MSVSATAERRADKGTDVRAVGAAVLSALIPGAGQLYARRPLRALAFFFPVVALALATFIFLDRGALGMADLLVRPTFLTGLLVVDVVVLIWRITAVVDAFLITSTAGERSWMAIPVALLLLFVAAPHAIAWEYGTRSISALTTTFVTASSEPAALSRTALPLGPRTVEEELQEPTTRRFILKESPRPAPFMVGLGDPLAVEAWVDMANINIEPAPYAPPANPLDGNRLTILLVGADEGPGRDGLRTDSMNVATVDLDTGQAALFGLPRNLKLMPLPQRFERSFIDLEKRVIEKDLTDEDGDGFPDHWVDEDGDGIPDEPEFESCKCFPTMLNKVRQYTQDWNRTYPYSPDPGLSALKDIVAHMLDLPIDYFVMVNMSGFVDVIDAIGGVDVFVQDPYHVTVSAPKEGGPKATINVGRGMNHLNGYEALAYTRWRRGSSDYHRMARQRCLVRAAVAQTDTLDLVRAFPTLLDVMQESVTTDIPIDYLPDLVWAAGAVDMTDIATVGFVPPRYSDGRTPGGYPIPDVDRIRFKVRDILDNGAAAQSSAGRSECA